MERFGQFKEEVTALEQNDLFEFKTHHPTFDNTVEYRFREENLQTVIEVTSVIEKPGLTGPGMTFCLGDLTGSFVAETVFWHENLKQSPVQSKILLKTAY